MNDLLPLGVEYNQWMIPIIWSEFLMFQRNLTVIKTRLKLSKKKWWFNSDIKCVNSVLYFSGPCLEDWHRLGKVCYKLAKYDRYNWFEAKHYCSRLAADMATPDTKLKQQYLSNYLYTSQKANGKHPVIYYHGREYTSQMACDKELVKYDHGGAYQPNGMW